VRRARPIEFVEARPLDRDLHVVRFAIGVGGAVRFAQPNPRPRPASDFLPVPLERETASDLVTADRDVVAVELCFPARRQKTQQRDRSKRSRCAGNLGCDVRATVPTCLVRRPDGESCTPGFGDVCESRNCDAPGTFGPVAPIMRCTGTR